MTEKSDFPRYDHPVLAWEYDQRQPAPFPGELDWYLKYIALSDSPILELTCGSGRLTIPLAVAGFQIDGVDRSKAMLKRLSDKLTTYDEKVRQRVRLFCADMIDFVPEGMHGCILLPYNSLQYLETVKNVSICFRRIATFLNAGGYFLFVVRRLNLSSFTYGKRVAYDSMDNPIADKEKKLSVGSRFVSNIDLSEHRVITEQTFRILHNSGETEQIRQVTYEPIIEVVDYIRMLERAGFDTKVNGGYNEQPDDGKSHELCFVCQKR